MTFLLPFILLILSVTPIVFGIVLTIKDYKAGPPLLILSIIPLIFLIISLVLFTTEKDDLKYIHEARLHAEYVEAGVVYDLAEYTDFCKQVVNANNMILKAREKKDNVWVGYCYFESVANQELIILDIKKMKGDKDDN